MTTSLPTHGGQLRAIAAQYGIAEEKLLDFSANIAPCGPPASVMVALQSALHRPEVITRYPDLDHAALKTSLAGAITVPSQNIAIANGFVPLFETFLDALHVRRCLLPVPAFLEYRRVLEQRSVAVTQLTWREDCDFAYDVEGLLHAARQAEADTILLANPQNPSGVLTSSSKLRLLVRLAAEAKIHILLDEAFIDYAPAESLTALTGEAANLTVFRSLTKFYAMPGLRVSYAVGHASLINSVEQRLAPWPVSTLASIAASAAVADQDHARSVLAESAEAREMLVAGLAELGHHVFPSAANFVLIRLNPSLDAMTFWERMIREYGIVLRACANYDGLDERYYRIAVRSREDNLRLLDVLKKIAANSCRAA